MRIKVKTTLRLRIPEAQSKLESAMRRSLQNTIVAIASDAVQGSPWLTGNNRRSIAWEVGPGGEVAIADFTAATFSASGYGGYLETGTVRMPPRPYFKPALDRNIHMLSDGIKAGLR